MAAITTHNIFAKDVFELLDKSLQKKLKPSFNYYLIFAQSFDFFLYSNQKKIRQFQKYTHQSNTQSYFINLIRNIINSKYTTDSESLAYLYGSITHYVLDSIMHPFIFYKSGLYNKKNKDSLKYNGLHTKVEFMLDSYVYEAKYKKRFYKYKFLNDLIPKVKPSTKLLNLIDNTYMKTYNKPDMSKYFFKSYNLSRLLYRLAAYDPYGLKKQIYGLVGMFNKNIKNLQYVSFYIKNFDYTLLNINHKEWYHPCDKNLKFNDSFLDLYNIALKKCVYIIEEISKVLNKDKDLKTLLEVIPNISYITGLPITDNKPLKYFEF